MLLDPPSDKPQKERGRRRRWEAEYHGTSSRSVDVRQREFGFGQRGSRVQELVTGDVLTCCAIVAIDRQNGLIFMAHLDVPWLRPASVKGALEELRDRASSVRNVDLYDVAGITPWMVMLVSLFPLAVCWFAGEFWWGLLFAAALNVIAGVRRVHARWVLWRLGFTSPCLLTLREASGQRRRWFDFRVNVRIGGDRPSDVGPELFLPERPDRDRRFEVQAVAEKAASGGRPSLTRAKGSE